VPNSLQINGFSKSNPRMVCYTCTRTIILALRTRKSYRYLDQSKLHVTCCRTYYIIMHELAKRPLSKLESLPNPAENPEVVNEAPYGTSTTPRRIAHLHNASITSVTRGTFFRVGRKKLKYNLPPFLSFSLPPSTSGNQFSAQPAELS